MRFPLVFPLGFGPQRVRGGRVGSNALGEERERGEGAEKEGEGEGTGPEKHQAGAPLFLGLVVVLLPCDFRDCNRFHHPADI